MDIAFADPANPPRDLTSFVGGFFRKEYSAPPWDEAWVCTACAPPDSYGPIGRYAASFAPADSQPICPQCHTKLEVFWSESRTARYLELVFTYPGAWLLVGRVDGQLAAWAWGYRLTEEISRLLQLDPMTTVYADVLCLAPQFRGRGTVEFIRDGQAMLFDLPDTTALVGRTHAAARHVHQAIARQGWQSTVVPGIDDPDRLFWVLQQTSQ